MACFALGMYITSGAIVILDILEFSQSKYLIFHLFTFFKSFSFFKMGSAFFRQSYTTTKD